MSEQESEQQKVSVEKVWKLNGNVMEDGDDSDINRGLKTMAKCSCRSETVETTFKRTALWKMQYAPRERQLKLMLNTSAWKKYQASSISKKIRLIDKFQLKGVFDKEVT